VRRHFHNIQMLSGCTYLYSQQRRVNEYYALLKHGLGLTLMDTIGLAFINAFLKPLILTLTV